MLLIVTEPVVAFAATGIVPVYVAVGVWHATLTGNDIALVVAGPPEIVLFTVKLPGLAFSGLPIAALDVPLAGSVAGGCV